MSSEDNVCAWDGTCNDCGYDRLECDVRGRCFMEEAVESGDAVKKVQARGGALQEKNRR